MRMHVLVCEPTQQEGCRSKLPRLDLRRDAGFEYVIGSLTNEADRFLHRIGNRAKQRNALRTLFDWQGHRIKHFGKDRFEPAFNLERIPVM